MRPTHEIDDPTWQDIWDRDKIIRDMQEPEVLEPGLYSIFVILEDGMWEQPTYRLKKAMPEREFRWAVEQKYPRCIFADCVGEDPDCPEENVEEL